MGQSGLCQCNGADQRPAEDIVVTVVAELTDTKIAACSLDGPEPSLPTESKDATSQVPLADCSDGSVASAAASGELAPSGRDCTCTQSQEPSKLEIEQPKCAGTEGGEIKESGEMTWLEDLVGQLGGAGANSIVDTFIKQLLADVESDRPPTDVAAQKAKEWRDISKRPATIYFKAKSNPARDCLSVRLNTDDQVDSLPLIEMQNDRIRLGAVPTILSAPYYQLWFPFCESGEILHRFSSECFIVYVKLKILFLHLDFLLFVKIFDRMETHGTVEAVLRSPPTGSEGKEWLGITVPERVGSLPRVCINSMHTCVTPKTTDKFNVKLQFEVEDIAGAPQWIKIFAIQQIMIRIIPEMVRFQSKIPGSALDTYLNTPGQEGGIDAQTLQLIHDLCRSVSDHVKQPGIKTTLAK